MFLNRRKEKDGAEEIASLPDDVKQKGKQSKEAGSNEEILVSQLANLEEMVTKRAQELEEAKQQLKSLYHAPGADEKDAEATAEEMLTRPNQAGDKPAKPAEETAGEDKEKAAESLLEKVNDAGTAEAEDEKTDGDSDDFFGDIEEEESSLAGLIASLPEVTADELLRDAEEIKILVQDWLPDEKNET